MISKFLPNPCRQNALKGISTYNKDHMHKFRTLPSCDHRYIAIESGTVVVAVAVVVIEAAVGETGLLRTSWFP
jgi:hypothetical protein